MSLIFLVLTNTTTSMPVRVNVAMIDFYEQILGHSGSRIVFVDDVLHVKESPEEIDAMILDCASLYRAPARETAGV